MSLTQSDYQTKVESAIEQLSHDLPNLFQKDISYKIYSSDIFFKDPVNLFQSKFNYRIIFWTLRFHARLFFTEIYFDVHDIQQIETNIIKVWWTVRGKLRVPWEANIFFNGDSTYTLNSEGLISDHRDSWDRAPKAILKQFLPQPKK
ncbi:DUF2358 domain-containing protein [Dactylococcopsis salina]|uniref:DUF2358 domain-containing protein n=1 Tax=Dactylococcopsis salina (strain PCC 8305) TaxID=13035 RepID=K9YTJ2_DACS8|nr:DUF2358 domain-containing protein [Dactylococcopsis salina]AFZ50246.1 hypothetical protein Dacsa_1567 [Dactylococcopsis salina PCC 8305]